MLWDLDKGSNVNGTSVENKFDNTINKYGEMFEDLPYYIGGTVIYIARLTIKFKNKKYDFLAINKKRDSFTNVRILMHPPVFGGMKKLSIQFGVVDNLNRYNSNNAYIENINAGVGEDKTTGTELLKLSDTILQKLKINKSFLIDASTIECENLAEGISLSLFKLLQNGISWYNKLGYNIDYNALQTMNPYLTKKRITNSLSNIRNLKIANALKELNERNDFLNFIIKNDLYKNIYLSNPIMFIDYFDKKYLIDQVNQEPSTYIENIKNLISDHLVATNEAINAIKNIPNSKNLKLHELINKLMDNKQCWKYAKIVHNIFLIKRSNWSANRADIYTLLYSTESAVPVQGENPMYKNKKLYKSELSWSSDFLVLVWAYHYRLIKKFKK